MEKGQGPRVTFMRENGERVTQHVDDLEPQKKKEKSSVGGGNWDRE